MTGEELPRARVRRTRVFRIVWVVPLLAAIVAGYLIFQRLAERGPEITLTFTDGGGLRAGQTPIRYRGVQIGEVISVGLTRDREQVLVKARLQRGAGDVAREGAVFWIVRPQLEWGAVTGLGTVLTGPEIRVLPGSGEPRREFAGRESAPPGPERPGLHVVLRAERPQSIGRNTPVIYRGVQVGQVQKLELGPKALSADIHILIWQRYADLVREGSAFWNRSGLNVRGSLLRGLEVELESLRSLVAGGIEFASPEKSARARPGSVFFLHEQARSEWLAWAPPIAIPPER
jgi:paraquat-inducible protein B